MRHSTRRALLLGLGAVAGCSVLPERPYQQKRVWPLAADDPSPVPGRRGAPVLLVRAMGAGPGLETRGLHGLLPDGSMRVEFWEEWAAPPAQAAEAALRARLAATGKFAAVAAPGTRLEARYALESQLLALWDNGTTATARIGWTLIDLGHDNAPLKQQTSVGEAHLADASAPARAAAQSAALAQALERLANAVP